MITGATGFAGRFLAEHYTERGARVHGTYRESAPASSRPPGVALHRVDLRAAAAVSDLVAHVRPDTVLHLAARSSATASWEAPVETIADNVAMQYAVLEAVLAHRPDARVLVVGSCDEYGNVPPEDSPVAEARELAPANPYALSKVAQDLMGRQYAEVHDLHVVRVRPFLQIGPHRSARFVAGSFARQVAEIELGLRPAVVEVGNVELRRDFTDVRDVARAYALAADRGTGGEVYNIASGTAYSLGEMLELMLQLADVRAEVRTREDLVRPRETPLLIGDASKLRAATGWGPCIAFEQSVADTLASWRQTVRRSVVTKGDRA